MKKITLLPFLLMSLVLNAQANGDTIEDAIEIDGIGNNTNTAVWNTATASGLIPQCTSSEDIYYKHVSNVGDNLVTIGMLSAGTTAFADIDYQIFKAPGGDMSQLEELSCDAYQVILLVGGSFEFEVEDTAEENTYFLRVYKASIGDMDLVTILDNSTITMNSRFEQSLANDDFDNNQFKMVVSQDDIEMVNNQDFNSFKIYSLDGKVVKSQNTNSIIENININGLKQGLYIVHLEGKSKRHVSKFIKQ